MDQGKGQVVHGDGGIDMPMGDMADTGGNRSMSPTLGREVQWEEEEVALNVSRLAEHAIPVQPPVGPDPGGY